jgi:hypothetical protein
MRRIISKKKEIDDEDDDYDDDDDDDDDNDDDLIANLKIQKVNNGQDKLSSAQDKDELKRKKIYKAIRLLESSFNPEASTVLQNIG